MPGFKGRALVYPALLIAGWIVGRTVSLSAEPVELAKPAVARAAEKISTSEAAFFSPSCPMAPPQMVHEIRVPALAQHRLKGQAGIQYRWIANESHIFGPVANPPWPNVPGNRPSDAEPNSSLGEKPSYSAMAASTDAMDPRQPKRLQLYGYNFWRQRSGGAGLAPNAQYGGSQYGAIATWDLLGQAGRGPALLLRASGTPDGAQREVAVGTRWQPKQDWPVSLSLERRFRANSPDSFAGYLAGGVDRLPIVGRLVLDAYGQAGYSIGGQSSPFVDAHARLQYPIAQPLGIPLRLGGGTWLGGQKGTFRGDVGPTLSADIDARLTKFTLQVDWRKRIVGNAAPADGLAVTVSTGF